MTSVNELFPKSRKLAYDARQQLSQVQNGLVPLSDLLLTLDELSAQLDIAEKLAEREPRPVQREQWKRKVSELREDCAAMQNRAERHDRIAAEGQRRRNDREELLRRRRGGRENGAQGDGRDMNNLTNENRSLSQSTSMALELQGSATATLEDLKDQRRRLRGVNRVAHIIANRLNLTDATMRVIERRDVTDAYLVLAGMVVTCIVIYLCYFYW